MNTIKNAPKAENAVILGEPVAGGTLIGSYFYAHPDDTPEGKSLYSWTADGELIQTTLELLITKEQASKRLAFTVTPVSENDERGDSVTSPEKLAYTGFQNITDEENENSFMKQHGNFSFYTPEPADRIFVSTGGAFSLLDNHTQNTYVRGQPDYAAVVPEAIKNYLKNNPALLLFSTERDFAALVPLGNQNQLLAWGNNIPKDLEPAKLRNIKSVYSNGNAFAFIYNKLNADNHWIGAIGSNAQGGAVPPEIHLKLVNDPPRAIYATFGAFAVLTESGKVFAWGDGNVGGTIDKNAQGYLDRMTVNRIIANMNAFCAIGTDDTLVTWGNAGNGGNIPADLLANILNQGGVKSVVANRAAFCAITKGRALAISWGNTTQGGTMNANAAALAARGNIVLCRAATWAFTMINASGQVEAWGAPNHGGTIPTSVNATLADLHYPFVSSERRSAFEAYFKSKLAAIYKTRFANNPEQQADDFSSNLERVGPRLIVGDGLVSVYGNDSSFFCMAQDEDQYTNELWVWGQANGGGLMPADTRQALMASRIRSVFCTNGAYGVICSQGSTEGTVLVWGATLAQQDAGEIPKVPPEIAEYLRKGIIEMYSIKRSPPVSPVPERVDPSFAARHIDGSYVLWGGNVDNQIFSPSDHESFN